MAFDGITIASLVRDIDQRLTGGRINKIYEPEADEINLVVKNNGQTYRLMLSASASLPLVYFLDENKQNPAVAPNFCMLLRKHVGSGRIVSVRQPEFERIIEIEIEHLDELGDVRRKKLICEIMGKHSNIIFTDEEGKIIDAIKRIGLNISSVREVLPGGQYVMPKSDKKDPLTIAENDFIDGILSKSGSVVNVICSSLTGISKTAAYEICYRAGVDGDFSTDSLADINRSKLFEAFSEIMEYVREGSYAPAIVVSGNKPIEFSVFELKMYNDMQAEHFEDVSEMLRAYYSKKDIDSRIRQKSADLRKVLSTALERTSKKYDLLQKQLLDTEKRDKFRVYGELLQAYAYQIEKGNASAKVLDYNTGNEVEIPLDRELTSMENSVKYFNKYNKLKRTYEATNVLLKETSESLMHLRSLEESMSIATSEADLNEIRQEMVVAGLLRARAEKKTGVKQEKSKPLHYISSDGFHMYVGKNNLQNDYLSFKFASSKDIWFHAKEMPGSHVIVRLEGADDVPDATYEEAARLAAFYSSGKTSPKVEIDYTRKVNLKKPPAAKPGYVIYHTNYSMTALPDIEGIEVYEE